MSFSFGFVKKFTIQITTAGSVDHQQITVTFAITLSGAFLRMQLIYQGTTQRYHPKFSFPGGFNVTHISNHSSNEEKAKEILLKIIIPSVQKTRKNLQLDNIKEWL